MHGDKLALDREWFIVCIACSAFSCDYYSWTVAWLSGIQSSNEPFPRDQWFTGNS
jgi:hypothetical protein